MLPKLSRNWSRWINAVLWSRLGRAVAPLWHRLMPSFAIRRRVFGLEVLFDSRDHPFAWYADRASLEHLENIDGVLTAVHGLVWDVGANAGIYTLRAASLGNPVIAFDLSPKAIGYIQRSAARNGLTNITTVPRAFSVTPMIYQQPLTAIAGNAIGDAKSGESATAITYLEAAAAYGIPVLIKMDIEGHEEVFLRSPEFKAWMIQHRIAWALELHRKEYWDLLWPDVPQERLSENVILLQPPA